MTGDQQSAQFREQRRAALRRQKEITGLDYMVAEPTEEPGRWRLRLHFLTFTPPNLKAANVRILNSEGKVETAFRVESLGSKTSDSLEAILRIDNRRRAEALDRDATEYTLELSGAKVDRFFSSVSFRFDGGSSEREISSARAAGPREATDIDYLAKDYDSFRRLMLETMSRLVPDWTERNPADVGITVVEALAAAADYLSYYQDAVGTEAYLDTARQRASVRRHLRLLGYFLHEGCNSRAWVHFEVAEERGTSSRKGTRLPKGTRLLTRAGDLPTELIDSSYEHDRATGQGSLVFQTMHEASLHADFNRMRIHTWGAEDYWLPRGATSVALAGNFPLLAAGDVLIFEEVKHRETGETSRADPGRRHAVRLSRPPTKESIDPLSRQPITEISFFEQDALPFPLTVRVSTPDGVIEDVTVVRGNIVLADHGETIFGARFELMAPAPHTLDILARDLTRAELFEHEASKLLSAAAALHQDPVRALPDLTLREHREGQGPGLWIPRRDLLESRQFASDFVVESHSDGRAQVRFGDGTQGRRPAAGATFEPVYRLGSGARGRIGPEALAHVVVDEPKAVFAKVRNPMPSRGGSAPESLEQARLVAPRAFRSRKSCVTLADCISRLTSHPEVLEAAAELRWTGSWNTVLLYVQRRGGGQLSPEFERRLRAFVEPLLVAGRDLEIRCPKALPLEIRLRGRVDKGFVREQVAEKISAALGTDEVEEGAFGYFHPDNFTFGRSIELGALLDEAMRVPGVLLMEAEVFRPYGTEPERAPVLDRIEPGPFEIVEMRNRLGSPETGSLSIELEANA